MTALVCLTACVCAYSVPYSTFHLHVIVPCSMMMKR